MERARKVNASGETVTLDPGGPLSDASWAGHQLSRATQALPNGYCQLPVVKTCPHANAPSPRPAPGHLAADHRCRGKRAGSRRRNEQAGRSQPREDHHRPASRRRRRKRSRRRCVLATTRRWPPPQPGGTSTPVPGPSRHCTSSTGQAPPRPSPPSPRQQGISRSWLYTQPDLRSQIQRLRGTTALPAGPALPARQHASDASLRARLTAALQRNRQLADEDTRLRRQHPRRPAHGQAPIR